MKKLIAIALLVFFSVSLLLNGSVLASAAVPNDPYFKNQWGFSNTGQSIRNICGMEGIDANILNAWEFTKGEQSVIVGVLDTGIDITHGDLSGCIYTNTKEIPGNGIDDDKNGYIDDVHGWDFANDDNTVFDNVTDDTHGTGLAGVIAASNDAGGMCGVAPNVKILPLKFRNGLYVDTDRALDAIDAIAYAKAMGASIINCSFTSPNMPDLEEAIKNSGMLFVCAANNSGHNLDDSPSFPCSYNLPNVLGVASINNKGELSTFSSYGARVQLAAPGENIYTTAPGNKLGFYSGTSLSAPYVTAAAALIKSYRPSLGANEIAEAIVSSVRPLDSLKGKVATGGMLDAAKALKYSGSNVIGSAGVKFELSGTKGTDDWYRSDVTVTMIPPSSSDLKIYYSYDKNDWRKYESPITVKHEGRTSLFYYLVDNAGMKGAVKDYEIKIDKSKPKIVLLSPKIGETFILGSKIALQYYVDEDISGVKGKERFRYETDYLAAGKIGANTMKLTAEDKAGNSSFLDVNYKVIYKCSFKVEAGKGNVLKCGSPLMVKMAVTDAKGVAVSNAKAKLFTAFVNNGTAAKETAAKSAISANISNNFTFDRKLKQYTYNLSTAGFKPGKWRLRIALDDGTSKFQDVVLK